MREKIATVWRRWVRWRGAKAASIVALCTILLALAVSVEPPTVTRATFTDVSMLARSGGAERVRVDGERLFVERASGPLEAIVGDAAARAALVERFAASGIPVEYEPSASAPATRALILGAGFLAVLGLAAFGTSTLRRRGRAHFEDVGGATTGERPVCFADVAGMHEAKDALGETIELLRRPEHFGRLGGRMPRGVLLTGQPGTGKTLLARAVAAEAGVPFLYASGSSFHEVFVGVGASRVRRLFTEARRVAPCIVFIDEIDALGRARGKGGDSAAAEHDQTLNQLLVEMDGMTGRAPVIVMASTNRADVLDPALLRPGRFDRHVPVGLPGCSERQEILGVHVRGVPLDADVELLDIARGTPGFSGADLANLVNEAAILAAREGADGVSALHLDRARDRVMMGMERKSLALDPDERRATAIHEAGHVAVAVTAPSADPIHKVSILPRGRALGVTQALPERDRLMITREHLTDQICVLLGGRAAEVVILGTMTAGASDDIQRAVTIARKMVGELGMSELGPIYAAEECSPGMIDKVEQAAHELVEAQLERAKDIVTTRRIEVERLVSALLEHDTLDSTGVRACFT